MNTTIYLPVKKFRFLFVAIIAVSTGLFSCTKMDVFEKNAVIPNSEWTFALAPAFEFDISDTAAAYNIYIVLRHTDAYRYNNIWLKIGTQAPGDSIRSQKFELQLGSDAKGWEGTGMDDIWEVRKLVTKNAPVQFNKAGTYRFTVAQIMRENPLPNIMNVGVRIEKVK